jgi:hypothetical protein
MAQPKLASAKKTSSKNSSRRIKGDGGLYLKSKKVKNPQTGLVEDVSYWQASHIAFSTM